MMSTQGTGPAGRRPARRLLLEVIATTVDDAAAAEQGGADRLELVRDLPRGGMTPPLAVVEAVLARVRIPVRVMIRRTVSHEIADAAVRSDLVGEAARLRGLPIDGLVAGALTGRLVDGDLLDQIGAAAGHRITFHRAFEDADEGGALARLSATPAVDRILTSGGPGPWPERAERLARLAALAAPRIRILVGGGIRDEDLPAVAAIPGIREVHVGRAAREPADDRAAVSEARVARLVARLLAAGPV